MTIQEIPCPYCAETIKAAAIVCRFCNRDLPRQASASKDNHAQVYSPCKQCGGTTRSAFLELTAGLCRECAVAAGKIAEGEPIVEDSYIYGKKGITPLAVPTRSGYTRNDSLICPHCGEKGGVQTKTEDRSEGISSTKLSAAMLTDGWSIFLGGLSAVTRLIACYCEKCGTTYTVR